MRYERVHYLQQLESERRRVKGEAAKVKNGRQRQRETNSHRPAKAIDGQIGAGMRHHEGLSIQEYK